MKYTNAYRFIMICESNYTDKSLKSIERLLDLITEGS
jgi:hypothetical protein